MTGVEVEAQVIDLRASNEIATIALVATSYDLVTDGAPELAIGAVPSELAVQAPTIDISIQSAGAPGPPSPGGSQEVFVQVTEPAQGATPWLLAQLDAPGGNVEFLKVYEP